MRRREFFTMIGAVAVWPSAAGAQKPATARLGLLVYDDPRGNVQIESFQAGLRDLGHVEGRNLNFELRSADGRPERLPELAAELVSLKPDVMMGFGGDVVPSLKKATDTIPIVFSISSDPVRLNLVASLARPAGNATGVTFLQDELASKRMQLFKEAAPGISHVACLWNPEHFDNELLEAQRAARTLNVRIQSFQLRASDNVDDVLKAAKESRADALYVVSSGRTVRSMSRIVGFASENRIPLVGGWGTWAQSGGLLSYGPNVLAMVRRTATHVDKILKGTKPADLPVEQPTRFELIVNLTTARQLGLTIPETFLLQADRVIE
jgi:putative ABC transport system substrate-binding protein